MWKGFPKTCLIKLKTTFVYEKLLNNWFFVAFLVVVGLISYHHWWVVFFLVALGLWVWKKQKLFLFVWLFVFGIITMVFILDNLRFKAIMHDEVTGVAVAVSIKSDHQVIKVKKQDQYYLVYDNQFTKLKLGNIIFVQGQAIAADKERIPNGFDYQKYLKNQKIVGRIVAKEITITGFQFCFSIITEFLTKQVKKQLDDESAAFLLAVILGNDDELDGEFSEAIKDNGILHLFAVSGLHITLFINIILSFLSFLKINEKNKMIFITIFLSLYLLVTSFSPSVFRATLMWGLATINQKKRLQLSSLDILSICFIMLLIINPFYMYNLGFQLSFFATLIIVLGGPLLEKYSSLLRIFGLSSLCLLFTLPLVININYQVNLLSPITNVFFILLFETIILPASIFVFLFPWLSYLYLPLIRAFKSLNMFFQSSFCIFLKLPKMGMFEIGLFYVLLFLITKMFFHPKPKPVLSLVLLSLMLVCFHNTNLLKPTSIYYLDIRGGEATVILAPKLECHAVIDTGTGEQEEVTTFLKSKGIRVLDLLILTHNHRDHNGEAFSIIKEFKVKQIITSYFDDGGYQNQAVKVKPNDQINCGKIPFLVLSPHQESKNVNNESLVLKARIENKWFLWMGDAEESIENKLMHQDIKADIIKIGHHGSKTSSSYLFLSQVMPEYAIIQTGRLAYLGFPDDQTINNLNKLKIKILRTDWHYSIVFKYQYRKWKVLYLADT
ncbi:MAG: DNA internalization-related competence protein ComEC/Rec2 [Bacilli bacterium]